MATKLNPEALDRIKQKRGFTTAGQLADHLGVDRVTLWRWRHGEVSPNFDVIARMVLEEGLDFCDLVLPDAGTKTEQVPA